MQFLPEAVSIPASPLPQLLRFGDQRSVAWGWPGAAPGCWGEPRLAGSVQERRTRSREGEDPGVFLLAAYFNTEEGWQKELYWQGGF